VQQNLLALANTLGGSLTTMAARISDLVVPGLGTLAETLIQFPQKLLAAVEPFVSALNPALLLTFNQQLANLQATVGTAFENVFNILAPVLDQVASLIQGVMDTLRPVIDSLATMFGGYLVEMAKSFVSEMKMLMPVIEVLMSVLQIVAALFEVQMAILRPIIEVLGFLLKVVLMPLNFALSVFAKVMEGINTILGVLDTVFSTIIETVQELITTFVEGLGLGNVFSMLEDVIKNVITVLLALIGFAAKFLGQDAFLDKLIKNLQGAAHAIAAPKDVAFKGVEQITKDIAAAAFVAGAGTQKSQTDLLGDGIKTLQEIRDGRLSFETWLENQINRIIAALTPGKERLERFEKDHPEVAGGTRGFFGGGILGQVF